VRRASGAPQEPQPAGDKPTAAAGAATAHPLDPLSAAEIAHAAEILIASGKVTGLRCVSLSLREPAKEELRLSAPDKPIARRAEGLLFDRRTGIGYETIVDLPKGAVESYKALPAGVQPPVLFEEALECEEAVRKSPKFLEALAKRGIDDANVVLIDPWVAGSYGTEPADYKGRRLVRPLAFVRPTEEGNAYARPLDNIVVIFDLNKREVLEVTDFGPIALPPEDGRYDRAANSHPRTGLKPLEITQPDGPSFAVSGYEVAWQKWRFRVGFTPREGLVLHAVSYEDAGRLRPILHRASINEMVVTYGDPGEQYYFKNVFDVGELFLGTMANSLTVGCDCLGTIRYFDAHLADTRGQPMTIKNAICLHEEDSGLLWKHRDFRTGQTEVRRSRRLSVSWIATAGNYDYAFYWHFYQDGSIQCEVKLTGIMNTTSFPPGQPSAFGVEVAPQLNAPFHQHIFCARLDVDIDGEKNSAYEVNTTSLPRGKGNPHGNAFRAAAKLLGNELAARRQVSSASARFWRVTSAEKKNRLGRSTAYRLVPGENGPPLVQPDSAIGQRAGFAFHNLWVTPYRPDERFAAGEYPNQHPGGDGLPQWTKADRKLHGEDLVLWYVFAHTHVPRTEDWPVMPIASLGFSLKPDGFFEQNPALDVPPPG
jgi:primary-amine oxidase